MAVEKTSVAGCLAKRLAKPLISMDDMRDDYLALGRGRLASEGQSVIGLIIQEQPEITIAEAAKAFRRDSSTLSSGAAR